MRKILIVDDHAIVRQGWKHILTEELPGAEYGEAGNGQELWEKVQTGSWDMVLLDIHMPGKNGLLVLKELREAYPNLPVLILSMYPERQYAVRVLKAGAAGYLTKESAPDELAMAIKKVLNGGKYISPTLVEHLAVQFDALSERASHLTLSDREFQVLCLLASGHSLKEIADQLHVSLSTVGTYRARILEKMQLRNNTELTHYAIEHGLVNRLIS